MTAIGFRILPIPKRPDKKLIAELGKMVTPHLSDSMERLYAGGPQLRPMHNGAKLCGPAFTVRTAPGGSALKRSARALSRPLPVRRIAQRLPCLANAVCYAADVSWQPRSL